MVGELIVAVCALAGCAVHRPSAPTATTVAKASFFFIVGSFLSLGLCGGSRRAREVTGLVLFRFFVALAPGPGFVILRPGLLFCAKHLFIAANVALSGKSQRESPPVAWHSLMVATSMNRRGWQIFSGRAQSRGARCTAPRFSLATAKTG